MQSTVNSLFEIPIEDSIGVVFKVDSYNVAVSVSDDDTLKSVNVNGFVLIHTSDPNTRLIGRIERVLRTEGRYIEPDGLESGEIIDYEVNNVVHITALGTLRGPGGTRTRTIFTRSVDILPEIGANCFLLDGEKLSVFTSLVADTTSATQSPLTLGSYSLAKDSKAIIDGDAFFQRHAMIVGSTGSGKSYTVARIVEQAASLPNTNMIIFDIHGEYAPLESHPNIIRYKIAGPGDLNNPGEQILFLPYWLLGYEDMLALILDRSDSNAPNQAMAFSNIVIDAKKVMLEQNEMNEVLKTFTIDSPVPFEMDYVIEELKRLNEEKVQRNGRTVNGPFNGKFDRFIPRLESKLKDRRYGFLFELDENKLNPDYLDKLIIKLMMPSSSENCGVKIIDFSEVPSDILPIVVSIIAKLVFQVQQWTVPNERYPIALVCDEAHLYLPSKQLANAAEIRALSHFERIAKEGRKYGVSLTIVSQRPSELNTTIMSQCNNVISLRLANQADKVAVCNLLPENLGGIKDVLPTLGVGEGIVVGDSCLLPTRIKIQEPEFKPVSKSLKFWTIWKEGTHIQQDLSKSVDNLRKQILK
ncbi:hypothetical protein GGQ77_002573 [Geobacillus thermodenitrificans]|jgi:DNA helicase HerA-like ATPase|uniref:ATP-binding protein n=1 Tax=Geobacillus thermodenitrificans TaxID=33940 RepID=UPI000DFED377|nr:ATP-binding protein [Geobacillus thermodenitrificans]MEC5188803.1 hypothetical protein [Geobacillus thermodenitrificans]STO36442.1 Type IV secretory pathway, VirB4 components [[Flavobacterium] thermophilum]